MRTRPEMGYATTISTCAVVVLAAVAGCGGYMRARPTPMTGKAKSFLQARAQPPPASALVDTAPTATVELTGAVERPGTLTLKPSLQTLRQALDAAGGTIPTDGTLRIRPGDDLTWKLFAQDGGAGSVVEIPLAALGETPVYLRPDDVIEVAVVETPPVAEAPAHALVTEAPAAAPAPVAAAPTAEPVLPAAVPVPPPAAANVERPQAPAIDAAALRVELANVRAELEDKLATLRKEVERLQQDQSRLPARLERAASQGGPAVAAKPPVAKTTTVKATEQAPVEKPGTQAEKATPPSRPAMVLVSGSVRSPGAYSIADVKTVGGAVRAAGDRADSNLAAVEVRPEGQRGALVGMGLGLGAPPAKTVVNLVAVESGKGSDVPLRGGEMIFVPTAPRSEQVR